MPPQTLPQNQPPTPVAAPPPAPAPVVAPVPVAPPTPPTPQPTIPPAPLPPPSAPINPQAPPTPAPTIGKSLFWDRLPEWLFFYGFVSIFLINFVNAVVDPKAFTALLVSNPFVPSFLPSAKFLVNVAAVNDLALGLFILSKWKKKWVYAWAGAWLLIVAITKAGHFIG